MLLSDWQVLSTRQWNPPVTNSVNDYPTYLIMQKKTKPANRIIIWLDKKLNHWITKCNHSQYGNHQTAINLMVSPWIYIPFHNKILSHRQDNTEYLDLVAGGDDIIWTEFHSYKAYFQKDNICTKVISPNILCSRPNWNYGYMSRHKKWTNFPIVQKDADNKWQFRTNFQPPNHCKQHWITAEMFIDYKTRLPTWIWWWVWKLCDPIGVSATVLLTNHGALSGCTPWCWKLWSWSWSEMYKWWGVNI